MLEERRRPPTRDRRRFGDVSLGQRLDTSEDSPSRPIRQARPRRLRRKRASAPRALGLGERAVARACRERDRRLAEYARLDPEILRALEGDRFPPAPLRKVWR